MMQLPVVMAITGASGAPYALRLLEQLLVAGCEVHLMLSASGRTVLQQEAGVALTTDDLSAVTVERLWRTEQGHAWWRRFADDCSYPDSPLVSGKLICHNVQNFMSSLASGSFLTAGMVICPCSGGTLSGVVHGASSNLIERAAEVHLKERRKLILVPRETPLSVFYLRNLRLAASAGAIVLPAMPGWYHGVKTIFDLIDFVVARVLDQLHIPHTLMRRWGEKPRHD